MTVCVGNGCRESAEPISSADEAETAEDDEEKVTPNKQEAAGGKPDVLSLFWQVPLYLLHLWTLK